MSTQYVAGVAYVEQGSLKATLDELRAFGKGPPRKAMRRGMTKAARYVARELKANTPVELGLMKKSIGFRVYTSRTGHIGAVIGPRRGFRVPVKRIERGKRAGQLRLATKRERVATELSVSRVLDAAHAEQLTRREQRRLRKAIEKHKGIQYRDPVRYGHLVEFGHKGPHAAGERPFVRPTFERTKVTAQQIIYSEIYAELLKERAK